MNLTKFQKEENEKHFKYYLSTINDGGFYYWLSEEEKMMIYNSKFHLTEIQYVKLLYITSEKFMKKYTTLLE